MNKDSKYHIIEEVDKPAPSKEEVPEKESPTEEAFFEEDGLTALNQLEEGKINIQDVPSLNLETLVASKGIRLKADNIDIDTIKSERIVQLKFRQLSATTLHGGLLFLNYENARLKKSCFDIIYDKKNTHVKQRLSKSRKWRYTHFRLFYHRNTPYLPQRFNCQ